MANTPFDDIGSNEILSTQISGIQDAVKNVEQSLDMGTEVIANEPLTLLADVIGAKRIAEAVGKRNWLKDPAPVIQQYVIDTWVTITLGFTIDHAGGAVIFSEDKDGQQYRASFTRVKNTSGFNVLESNVETHLSDYTSHGDVSSRYRTGKDTEGIFTTIEWKRLDGTLAKKSVLSGGTSPQYEVRTVTYYDEDGITVKETVIYDQYYDEDGDWTHEVIRA